MCTSFVSINIFANFLKGLNVDKINFLIAPDPLEIDKFLIKLHENLIGDLPVNRQNQTSQPGCRRLFLICKLKKINRISIDIALILICSDSQIVIILIFIILINQSFSL